MITFDELKLLLEVSIDQLRRDWVDAGKISADLFELLCKCTNNQSAYATWLVKRIGDNTNNKTAYENIVKDPESRARLSGLIEAWQTHFNNFNKYKQYLEKKDINQYKTLEEFIAALNQAENIAKEKARLKDVDRFKIGTVEASNGVGYVVYKLPQNHFENHPISIELAKVSGGKYGGAGWCTGSPDHIEYWNNHIAAEDLYIFINPKDKLHDKFQIQFGYYNDRPFPGMTDIAMSNVDVIPYLPFYDFLHEKEGREIPSFVEKAKKLEEKLKDPKVNFEGFKVDDGVYRISPYSSIVDEVTGTLIQILGVTNEDAVDVYRLCTKNSELFSDTYFISTTEDIQPGKFAAFKIRDGRYRRYYGITRKLTLAMKADSTPDVEGISTSVVEAFNKVFNITEEDKSGVVLFNRVKKLSEDRRAVFSREVNACFHDFLHPRRVSVRAARAQANGGADSSAVEQRLSEYRKAQVGTATFYMISPDEIHYLFDDLENAEQKTEKLRNAVEGELGVVIQKGIALIISDILRGAEHEDATIYGDMYKLIHRIDLATGTDMPNKMNPDALYDIYAKFKQTTPEITYPPMIARIQALREGELDEYLQDWRPDGVSKLYKIPTQTAVDVIPYSFPESMWRDGYILMGFISKWQFTLSNSGYFMLTGRWGSAGSKSWINSVPGLSQALIEICDHYHINRAGALSQLREMCDRHNIEYPAILREALLEESRKDLNECAEDCKDIWLDYILG